MSADEATLLGGAAAVVVLGVVLGRWAPTWALLGVFALAPLRLDVLPAVHMATLLLCGAVCGRAPAIVGVLREERAFLVATLALPLWIALSAAWAQQPAFVFGLWVKWAVVVLAAWLAAADRTRDPRLLVGAVFVSMIPHALWGAAERLELIAPRGEAETLKYRVIVFQGDVRGRALFWHPNRLGEYLEQVGLLLGGAGLGGVLPWMCLVGFAVALAGVWGTGSMGSLGTLGGGIFLVAAWMLAGRNLSREARRRTFGIAAVAIVLAVGVAVFAFQAHGGVGSRGQVFRFAADRIAERPWLGAGAGNWSLLVGQAPLGLSRYWFRGHAHSLPLHVWVELGVVGVVLLVGFFAVPLWSAVRRFSGAPAAWYGVGVGAAFAVAGLFAHNFVHYFLRDSVDGIVTGVLLGTAIAVARRAPSEPT